MISTRRKSAIYRRESKKGMTDQKKVSDQSAGGMSTAAKEAQREYQRKYRANMTEEQKEARRAYRRKWAKEHPERVKKHTSDYWERRAARAAAKEGEHPGAAPEADHKADI